MNEYKFCVDTIEGWYITLTEKDFANLAKEVKDYISKWTRLYTANDIRAVAKNFLAEFVEDYCIKAFNLDPNSLFDLSTGLDYDDTEYCAYEIVERIPITIQ